jgi:hypothetical protein
MGIGVSIFLLALGAILAFAVNFNASGIDINTIGVILMIVGAIGIVTSMFLWDRMGFGYGRSRTVVHDDVVDAPAGRRVVRERRTVRDDELI